MSQRWLNTAQRAFKQAHALIVLFYYRKYFEWGLPTRRFVQVNIETNTICNRTCHFCLYGVKDEVPANPMPAGLFFKIIDQLAEMKFVGRISLFSTNEPLTDKRIYEFIRYASLMLPSSCHSLVSNGDLLNHERLDRLFASGLDLLLINSYDEEALEQNRDLVEYARSKHPDKILHTDRTVYNDWVSRAGHIQQYGKTLDQGYCDLPNYALYINPKGHVLSCCHDFDSQNLMGDLTRQSVKDAWYGQQFAALRKQLNKGDRSVSELCNGCDHKPDLAYFQWNATLPKVKGKSSGWFAGRPQAAALNEAQAIKTKYLEREQRSQAKQAKRLQRKFIPIQPMLENE